MIHFSVVIPTYNEKESISILLEQWKTVANARSECIEVIIVDDDSPDGTASVARTFSGELQQLVVIQESCVLIKSRQLVLQDLLTLRKVQVKFQPLLVD